MNNDLLMCVYVWCSVGGTNSVLLYCLGFDAKEVVKGVLFGPVMWLFVLIALIANNKRRAND